jgi:hypothetical protein
MKEQFGVRIVRIHIKVVDSRGIETRRPPNEPMDDVTLAQQQLREVGTVLASDSRDQSSFHYDSPTVSSGM